MRIHTNTLTPADLTAAAERAGRAVTMTYSQYGSRSHARAYDVTLRGSSSRRPNSGNGGRFRDDDPNAPHEHAATWDEWGMFLGELFRRDPGAVVPRVYESADHFRWATDGRFDALTPDRQHGRAGHRWEPMGTAASGTYYVHECKTCDARTRNVAFGHTWAEIDGEV